VDNLLVLLIVGAVAGWLASLLMKGKKLSIGAYLVLGIIGAFVGRGVFHVLGFHATTLIAEIIIATIGAMIVIWAVNAIWKPR